jgi:WD40-like Beta Propeller Repeat
MKYALENIARSGAREPINLWPKIEARLNERKSFVKTLRTHPMLAVLIVILIVLLLTGAAYAIGLLTGYIPGIGFVQTSSLRMLAEPVSQTRQAVTVTIEQVVVDAQRTVIVYKTEGLTIAAANSKGEGGPFGAPASLRLPDGTNLASSTENGYGGTPEPLVNDIHTEGGWPNYVWRLVYPTVPAEVNELTLFIPILQTMPSGAAPENWEITFHLKPAPPDMTFAPITELAGVSTSLQTESPVAPSAGETNTPALSRTATLHGFTFQLDNVIELDDGFVFTGSLSWDDSAFPTGKGMLAEAAIPTLTDENGRQIPIEQVQLNAAYDEHHAPWSYRTNRKAFTGPLVLSIQSIKASVTAPAIDFAIDFGSNPKIGQAWQIDHDFVVEGHTLRLLSVGLEPVPNTCQGVGIDFNFRGDVPGIGAYIGDVVPVTPMVCASNGGGGGGGGGPVDPNVFSTGISYKDIPSGVHHFSLSVSVPYEVQGPWQVTWNPPAAAGPTPTSEPEACLTAGKWQQLLDRNDPLPPELEGHILVSADAGPSPTSNFPLLQISNLDGSDRRDLVHGGWSALSPDGARLIYNDEKGLHLLDISTGLDTLLGFDGSVPVWSPDGTRIMYATFSGLYVMNADGSGSQKIDTGAAQVINPIGSLPDNQTVVYSVYGEGFTFWMSHLQSGETKKLFSIVSKAGLGVLSPDGQWIAFSDRVFGGNGPGIFVSRLDGSERRFVASSEVPAAFYPAWSPDGKWLLVSTTEYSQANPTPVYRPMAIELATCRVVALPPAQGDVLSWGK